MTEKNSSPDKIKISLSVSRDELEKFCDKLLKRSRDIAKTHDSLSTLEAFFTVFGKAAHGTSEYYAIEDVLNRYSEITRQQLLDERTGQLLESLKKHNIELITGIHVPLSRSGFYQILETAISSLTTGELAGLASWTNQWVTEAKQKAEQASGYPDAMDFKKANINIEQYQAMFDVNHFVTSL